MSLTTLLSALPGFLYSPAMSTHSITCCVYEIVMSIARKIFHVNTCILILFGV